MYKIFNHFRVPFTQTFFSTSAYKPSRRNQFLLIILKSDEIRQNQKNDTKENMPTINLSFHLMIIQKTLNKLTFYEHETDL